MAVKAELEIIDQPCLSGIDFKMAKGDFLAVVG